MLDDNADLSDCGVYKTIYRQRSVVDIQVVPNRTITVWITQNDMSDWEKQVEFTQVSFLPGTKVPGVIFPESYPPDRICHFLKFQIEAFRRVNSSHRFEHWAALPLFGLGGIGTDRDAYPKKENVSIAPLHAEISSIPVLNDIQVYLAHQNDAGEAEVSCIPFELKQFSSEESKFLHTLPSHQDYIDNYLCPKIIDLLKSIYAF